MRVYIMTDLEGVAGVLDSENWCLKDSQYYDQAKELLTREVNAAVDGFVAAGAKEVLVADGHGWGGIVPGLLHPRAQLAARWPAGKAYPFCLDDGRFDAAAWIGQHPMAGTPLGHLCHTGSMDVREARINGIAVGEFAECALCAGELGIPVIFASGCEAFTREAGQFIAGIETVAVKRGTQTDPGHALSAKVYRSHNASAIHLAPEEARRRIEAGARKALKRMKAKPFGRVPMPKPPYEMVIVMRADETQPARVLRKQHPDSLAALLNMPWTPVRTLPSDPLEAFLRTKG